MADLFGGNTSTAAPSIGGLPAQTTPAYPTIMAFSKGGVSVTFSFSKPPGNLATTDIQAMYQNSNPVPVTDFNLQAAVPKFMQVRLNPATATLLGPNGGSSATQTLTVTNSMHGQKPLVMRLRISYVINGTAVTDQCEVNNFPAGL